mgnify:CR=1 FL=1
MATQAEAAVLMLEACQQSLALIEQHFPAAHGRADVGMTWGNLCQAIVTGREAVMSGRRYVARPRQSGESWEVIDTRHALGARDVGRFRFSSDAIALEQALNAQA